MKCPLCGSKVHYEGLFGIECEGHAVTRGCKGLLEVLARGACPNYKPQLAPRRVVFKDLKVGDQLRLFTRPGVIYTVTELCLGYAAFSILDRGVFTKGALMESETIEALMDYRFP
jgi:hypothetical protein